MSRRDVDVIKHGFVRGGCLLLTMENFDPVVYCSSPLSKGQMVGLYASRIGVRIPPDFHNRNAMWITDLEVDDAAYNGPPLCFSTVEGGNIFRFLRHSRVLDHQRTPNVTVEVVWYQNRPYLVVRALHDITKGSELLYDWGQEFVAQLDLFDIHLASMVSHSIHKYYFTLLDQFAYLELSTPPWSLVSMPSRIEVNMDQNRSEVVLSDGTVYVFRRNTPPLLLESPVVEGGRHRQAPVGLPWDYGFAPINLRQVMQEKHVRYCAEQEVTPAAKALMESLRMDSRPNDWRREFASDHHDRVKMLMNTSNLTHVEVRRIDSLAHHVRWTSVPSATHYGLLVTESVPARFPLVAYKGRMCLSSESAEQMSNTGCLHYCSQAPDGIDVVIDCSSIGNEGRFVNDDRGSFLESNAEYVWTWDATRKELFLFVVTTEALEKGDEVLASYGDQFWNAAQSLQLSSHCKYWSGMLPRLRQLERVLWSSGLGIPDVPILTAPLLLEQCEVLFAEALPGMYPGKHMDFEAVEPYACFAEAVVGVRGLNTANTQVLIKFNGWDMSWNQWMDRNDASLDPSLMEEFLAFRGDSFELAEAAWTDEFDKIRNEKRRRIQPLKYMPSPRKK